VTGVTTLPVDAPDAVRGEPFGSAQRKRIILYCSCENTSFSFSRGVPRNAQEVKWVQRNETHRSVVHLGWWVPFHFTHPTMPKINPRIMGPSEGLDSRRTVHL